MIFVPLAEKVTCAGDYKEFIYLDNMMRKGNMSIHYESLCKQFVEKYIAIVTVETPADVITLTKRELSVTFLEKMGIIGIVITVVEFHSVSGESLLYGNEHLQRTLSS